MSTRAQTRFGASSLLLLAIAFVVAVIVSDHLFKGLRIDLTENRLYTLSDGTKAVVRRIDEPITLYFFFSDQATRSAPSIRDYATRVREMLEEFAVASRGKLHLRIVDPLPFSEEEDQAAQFGLQSVRFAATSAPIYMGLAGTNSVGDEEIIPVFYPDKETSLEYDIAKLVSTLAEPERNAVGLISGVPMAGQFDPRTRGMRPPWVVYQQVSQVFEVRELGTSVDVIPDDIGVLWIVQPKDLSESTQYAIDQFVMRGGKALVFVDPMAVIDTAVPAGMPQGMPPIGQSSDLPTLFKGWGIGFDAQEVVTDARLALQINAGPGNPPVRHYGILGITRNLLNAGDAVTAELGSLNTAMAGHLRALENSKASLKPLFSSSPASMTMPASRFAMLPDPTALQQGFTPGGEELVIAARIDGKLASAFADGKPETAPETKGDGESVEHLAESASPTNLIVVADVDMLSDQMWVQVQNFFGQTIADPFASNGAFVVNALENLAGSSDLISIRSRGSYSRPFTKVQELRVDAEARFLQTQQRLERELAETERRLGELQSAREDTGSLLLTDEQQAEIDRFIDQRASIRKELRAVQRGLDKDIEDLGTILKVINIGLVPLLLTVGTLIVIWRRRQTDDA
jgi:ABC-type uncharacterized transport system involved in gliding motility auxiliary subunit